MAVEGAPVWSSIEERVEGGASHEGGPRAGRRWGFRVQLREIDDNHRGMTKWSKQIARISARGPRCLFWARLEHVQHVRELNSFETLFAGGERPLGVDVRTLAGTSMTPIAFH